MDSAERDDRTAGRSIEHPEESELISSSLKWARRRDIILTLVGWGLAIAFIGWLLGYIVETLVIVAFAVVIALILMPLVRLFARKMPWGLAVLCSYVVALIVVVAFIYWVGTNLTTEIAQLIHNVPTYRSELQNLLTQVQSFLNQRGMHVNLNPSAIGGAIFSYIGTSAGQIASFATGVISTVATVLAGIVLAIVISIYLAIDGPRAARTLREVMPLSHRGRVARYQRILNRVLGGYIRGQFTLAILVGVLVGVGMWLLGVPYAVILGVFAFLFEFVPILGVIGSGALCVIFALTVSPLTALWVLLYFIGVHVFEGDVVGPRIVGNAVGLHPAFSIIALISGAEVGGLLGALFAVPIAGSLQALALAIYDEFRSPDAAPLPLSSRPREGEQTMLTRRLVRWLGREFVAVGGQVVQMARKVPWLNWLPRRSTEERTSLARLEPERSEPRDDAGAREQAPSPPGDAVKS